METILLSIHVVAGILFVGPVAVASSLFPRYAPVVAGTGEVDDVRDAGVARALFRITRVYGQLALVVPIVGLVLAAVQGRTGDPWVVAAMVLTAAAGALLAAQIAPRQAEALRAPDDGSQLRRLAMLAGILNLLWVVVVVLMIARPGASS